MKFIIMNKKMTKAILDGHKIQTRRVIKVDTVSYDNPTILEPDSCVKFNFAAGGCQNHSVAPLFINSKYKKDEVVWVREPARVSSINISNDNKLMYEYLADDGLKPTDKRYKVNLYSVEMPSRFLDENGEVNRQWIIRKKGVPNGCIKEMARIFLKITNVRVEKLQDISDNDIFKEGFSDFVIVDGLSRFSPKAPKRWWKNLWDKTAPKGYKWENNPYVFVYDIERVIL